MMLALKPCMSERDSVFEKKTLHSYNGRENTAVLFENKMSVDFGSFVGFCGVCGTENRKIYTDYSKAFSGIDASQNDIAAVDCKCSDALFFIGYADSYNKAIKTVEEISIKKYNSEELTAHKFALSMIPEISVSCKSIPTEIFLPLSAYQAAASRYFARAGFYQASGAFGFRDQLQDCLCLVFSMPDEVKKHIIRCAEHQYTEGDVQHWWHSLRYGDRTVSKGLRSKCSDDYLFLPYVVADYIKKTGDYSLLDTDIEYLSSPQLEGTHERYEEISGSGFSESLYLHCLRAIEYGEKFGIHGISLMGSCDWNDGFSAVGIEGKGESVFNAWFYIIVLKSFMPLATERGDTELVNHWNCVIDDLRKSIEDNCYFGDRYARGFFDDGTPFGVESSKSCKIDILAQAFAAIANDGSNERISKALDKAYEILYDKYNKLFKLFTPAFNQYGEYAGYINGYPEGIRENAGQYTHGAIWGAWGFLKAGKTEYALEILSAINPVRRASEKSVYASYRSEPYAICADIYSAEGFEGRGGWSWYTGAAGWYYKTMIEQVFGINITHNRNYKPFSSIEINPKTEYDARLILFGKTVNISARNGEYGVYINGKKSSFPFDLETVNGNECDILVVF